MDDSGQACFVEYQYGVDQALAVSQNASKQYNPRIQDLPSVGALVGFYHACLRFPVKQSWLEAIKAGNFDSLEGLTYSNVARYCLDSDETIKGHMAQQRQNVRSTKPKQPTAPWVVLESDNTHSDEELPSNQLFIRTFPISKLYTDDNG